MTDQEKRKIELQAQIDQLQSVHESIDAEEKGLQEELKKLNVPELRHGDYGLHHIGSSWFTTKRNGVLEIFGTKSGSGMPPAELNGNRVYLGNIFDDLERNSKDLTNLVTVNYQKGVGIKIEILDDRIFLWISGDGGRLEHTILSIERYEKFCQKNNQLLATLKRQQNA